MDADKQSPESQSLMLGRLLREQREARGLSMGEVADRLKLSLKQLSAIEQGDFASLPGTPFARGFIRSYARYLDIDSEALQAQLDVCLPLSEPVATMAAAVSVQPAARRVPWLLPAVVVLLLAAGIWLWLAAKPAAISVPVPALPAATPASAPLPVPVAPAAVAASQPAAVVSPVAMPVPASAPQAAASGAGIVLQTRGDAWVSITDASGKKLLFATVPADSRRQLAGQPPFRVTIGNAPQVTLSYNGQPVDLAGKTRGTTAKLELN